MKIEHLLLIIICLVLLYYYCSPSIEKFDDPNKLTDLEAVQNLGSIAKQLMTDGVNVPGNINATGTCSFANGAFTVDKNGNVTINGNITVKGTINGSTINNGAINASSITTSGAINGSAITSSTITTTTATITDSLKVTNDVSLKTLSGADGYKFLNYDDPSKKSYLNLGGVPALTTNCSHGIENWHFGCNAYNNLNS